MLTSLRARVLLLLAAFGLTIAVALALISYQSIRAYYTDVQYKRSVEFAERLVTIHPDMWENYEQNPADFGRYLEKYILYAPDTGLYLLDMNGAVLASAGENRLFWSNYRVDLASIMQAKRERPGQPVFADDPDVIGGMCLVAAQPVMSNGEVKGWLYVVARNADTDTAPLTLLKAYAVRTGAKIGLLTIAMGVLLTMAIIAMMTRPLAGLTRVAERIKQSGFAADAEVGFIDIPHCGREDEIGRLGRTFQEMLARLREEMQRVTQADAKRREMVSSVSHDLRTPLTALTAQLETVMLKGCEMEQSQREVFYARALHNAEHLKGLTDSLAEVSRLDNPEFRAQPEPIALGELTDDVVQRFAATAEKKGVGLSVDYRDGLPLSDLDASLIERALANLIDNALRVTPVGGEVNVAVQERPDGLRVQVRDTGPGVSPDDQSRVFDLFYQASKHRENRGSSGLGLALVRRVAELHGGIAGLNSKLGQGSTFFIDLPRATGMVQPA
ncbi:MAG: ATP-binding protein [Burkholderiaceae bacterium]